MAFEEPTNIKTLLPGVLGNLARESGRATRLQPLWAELVGPSIAHHARPLCVEGDTLVVQVPSTGWVAELGRREEDLRARLNHRLTGRPFSRLEFRMP